jgi:hypothetical protein
VYIFGALGYFSRMVTHILAIESPRLDYFFICTGEVCRHSSTLPSRTRNSDRIPSQSRYGNCLSEYSNIANNPCQIPSQSRWGNCLSTR